MKKKATLFIFLVLCVIFTACVPVAQTQVAATTLPVYQFTLSICEGTPITVSRLITESVSCLHDYSLTVNQMRAIEGAEVVVISGAGLEDFMEESLKNAKFTIDASKDVTLMEGGHSHHEEDEKSEHHHDMDAHIWLSPTNAITMANTICSGLSQQYPQYASTFQENLENLVQQLDELNEYGMAQLQNLSCRDLITFHDGFSYLAEAFDLEILEAIEEESGSEASADEITHLINLVQQHHIPAIFTETNGSVSAASVISAETKVPVFTLDMAMSGDDYFTSMYHNIDTLKEALQ